MGCEDELWTHGQEENTLTLSCEFMLDQVLLRTCTFENHWLVGYNQPLWRTLRGNEVYLIHKHIKKVHLRKTAWNSAKSDYPRQWSNLADQSSIQLIKKVLSASVLLCQHWHQLLPCTYANLLYCNLVVSCQPPTNSFMRDAPLLIFMLL